MARTLVAKQEPKLPTVTQAANVFDIALSAADTSNQNYGLIGGGEVLVALNTHATNPYTVTVTSTKDGNKNRSGDIEAFSLGAGEMAIIGPFTRDGWEQSGNDAGRIHFEAENAAVKFAWVKPRPYSGG